VRYGHLMMMSSGQALPEDDAVYVVQSGIVCVVYAPQLGETQEYFLGTGGVFNLYTALTGGLGLACVGGGAPGACLALVLFALWRARPSLHRPAASPPCPAFTPPCLRPPRAHPSPPKARCCPATARPRRAATRWARAP
jgi:hypothetical protein